MIKYTLAALLVGVSAQAAEAINQPNLPNETTVEAASAPAVQPLAETIELIIQDLEKAVILMDHPHRAVIEDNLVTIYQEAHALVVKLLALTQIDKLADFGVEKAQALRLFKTYAQFKKRFVSIFAVEEVPAPQAEITIEQMLQ